MEARAAKAAAQSAKAAADSAQSAAKDAQSTADKATLEAADAHNAAVLAEQKATDLRSDILAGPSVWEDPSFERGKGPLPRLVDGKIKRVKENATSGSWSIRYTVASRLNLIEDEDVAPLPIIEGHVYMVSANVKAEDGITWTFLAQDKTPGSSNNCLLYTSPSPRDATLSRMPSSA